MEHYNHFNVSVLPPEFTRTTNVRLEGMCGWCNGFHSGKCPKVKAIEYHPNGSVKRVEFK